MSSASLNQTLQELRSEYGAVDLEVAEIRFHLHAKETRLTYLRDAIDSLERLENFSHDYAKQSGSPYQSSVASVSDGTVTPPTENDDDDDDEETVTVTISEDSPISKYLARGGEGRRLKSTQMVTDVVDVLDRIVTREEIKTAFFQYFPREDMEILWDRPDNAFGNALSRAVKDKLIVRDNRNDNEIFASRAVVKRLKEQRAAKAAPAQQLKKEDE